MAGYTRQDIVNNIADGNIINASDFDNEYDAIEAAFSAVSGHTHDGTAAEGAPITKVGPNQDVVVSASAVLPKTDNTLDLGSSSFEFKDLYIDGTANIDSLVADTADINAGTIDGVVIGGASAGAGTFTSLNASGNVSFDGGSFVFNEAGADRDARFEGDGDPNLLFLDASTDRVGIGTSSPGAKMHVSNGSNSDSGDFTAFVFGGTDATNSRTASFIKGTSTPYNTIFRYQNNTGTTTGNLIFQNGSTEQMRLDSSGNLGLGVTPSAWQSAYEALEVGNSLGIIGGSNAADLLYNAFINSSGNPIYRATDTASYYSLAQGKHRWGVAPSGTAGNPITFTQAMTLDASGHLGIGTGSPSARLHVNASTNGAGLVVGQSSQTASLVNIGIGYVTTGYPFVGTNANSNPLEIGTLSNTHTAFITNNTERARITSSGALLLGTTDGNLSSGVGYKFAVGGSWGVVINQASTYNSFHYYNENAINNGYRFYVQADGGVANYSGNNVNLSDARVKTDIKPAPSYWNLIKAIEIVTFKYKDQDHSGNTIGVIAQQVERVAPELVDNRGFGETPEDGTPLKAVFSNDMYHAAIGALQEAMRRIETLEAKVAALEAK